MFHPGNYLTNGSLTVPTLDRLVQDAWDQNWDIPTVKEAVSFLSTYPGVADGGQHRSLIEKTRLIAIGQLQRVLVRQYSQRLQDFFKSKEDHCE